MALWTLGRCRAPVRWDQEQKRCEGKAQLAVSRLTPAPTSSLKKKPSVCRHKPEIIVSRWCAHCSVSAFNRVISTRLALLRPNGQTVIKFGVPLGLAPTDQGLLLSPFDCHTRHPEQIPLWVAITVSVPKHLDSKTDRGFGRWAGESLRVVHMWGQS